MEFNNLLALIEAVSASELTGLKYEENGVKLHLTKQQEKVQFVNTASPSHCMEVPTLIPATALSAENPTGVTAAFAAVPAEETELGGKLVKSPLVGTFYAATSEDAAPFVAAGDTVKKGQTLAIIEAMKLMNEIECEFDGTIAEVLVENGQAVEYGQPLFRLN